MPRKFFRRWAPSKETVLSPSFMQPFAKWLSHPNLWHFNRRSVSGGVAVGLFIAFLPIPFQMVLAAIAAVFLRVNVALAVAMALLSNPLTMVPIFWTAYMIGSWLTGRSIALPQSGISFEWVMAQIHTIWLPMLLGLLSISTVSSVVSFVVIRVLWRLNVILHKRRKQHERASNIDKK
ncbi:MAG: DUF2062 domain-containing protein [Halothiobacillus sp.]